MIKSDDDWRGLADSFNTAAIDMKGWQGALEQLAAATGSRCGQLIGLGPAAERFNFVTDFDVDGLASYEEHGGNHPDFNPRVAAGMAAPVLEVIAEADFLPADEHRRHPHYEDFARPWDIPFSCLANLERCEDLLIGLAVLRSARQGHITEEQRRIFGAVTPFVRAAVRTQMALEDQAACMLTGTMDALGTAAFMCDRKGRVKALTGAAEALLASVCPVDLRSQRLHAADPVDMKALSDAVERAADYTRLGRPILQTVVVRGRDRHEHPVILDVVAVPPRDCELSFVPRVLVVVRGRGDSRGRKAVLRAAYDMTDAESEIALQLAAGRTADVIADARCVSIGTVRTQIKAIRAKMGMASQVELVARLNCL